MSALGIIPCGAGMIVHGYWASDLSYARCRHGLCGAHLLLKLAFNLGANVDAGAKNMTELFGPLHANRQARVVSTVVIVH